MYIAIFWFYNKLLQCSLSSKIPHSCRLSFAIPEKVIIGEGRDIAGEIGGDKGRMLQSTIYDLNLGYVVVMRRELVDFRYFLHRNWEYKTRVSGMKLFTLTLAFSARLCSIPSINTAPHLIHCMN